VAAGALAQVQEAEFLTIRLETLVTDRVHVPC